MSAAEYWTGGGHERSLDNERQFQARRKAGDAKQRGQEMPNSGYSGVVPDEAFTEEE
jgi:hypothetical protein